MTLCPHCGQEVPAREVESALPACVGRITLRELEVLGCWMDGMTAYEIARKLRISKHTVHSHTANVFGKLGVSNRTEAVLACLRLGLVHL